VNRVRLGLVVALGTMLTGCQLYWQKPGANLAAFSVDHRSCVGTAGTVLPGEDRVLVNLDLYRACLRYRGWKRETGSKFSNPPGYFRGAGRRRPREARRRAGAGSHRRGDTAPTELAGSAARGRITAHRRAPVAARRSRRSHCGELIAGSMHCSDKETSTGVRLSWWMVSRRVDMCSRTLA
jgi:hypothetical protein